MTTVLQVPADDPRLVRLARAQQEELAQRYAENPDHGYAQPPLHPDAIWLLLLAADGEAVGCVAVQPLAHTVPGAPAEVGEVKRLYVAPTRPAAAAGPGCSWPRRRRSRRRPGSGRLQLETGLRQPEALALYRRSRVHRHRAVRPLPRQPAVGVPHQDARPARGLTRPVTARCR